MSLKDALRAGIAERSKQESEQATNEVSDKDSKIANNNDSKIAKSDLSAELVGLNVRAPKNHRLHWLIEAKRQGTSLTAAVNEALAARFGLPDDKD